MTVTVRRSSRPVGPLLLDPDGQIAFGYGVRRPA